MGFIAGTNGPDSPRNFIFSGFFSDLLFFAGAGNGWKKRSFNL
jgi:hypothetical protein